MTHDTHATASSRQAGRRHPRPDLGRPSLFADFDQESVEDIEPQRIRLLSTLESQRGARAHGRTRRRPTGRANPWLTRALTVAMALGMLVMLLSFIQLLRRPPSALQTPQAMAATAAVVRAAAATASAPPIEAAEIIDLSPPAGGLPQDPALAPPAPPHPTETSAVVAATGQHAAPSAAPRSTMASASEPERISPTAKPGNPRSSTKRDAGASHDDVALVEAMLAHAGPRKTLPSPTVALQQCGTGTSPEASVCRARVCVQHPSLPACHTP